ncbi:MAG: hypothetical protein RJB14_1421 [Pseudomonadota bacterium]
MLRGLPVERYSEEDIQIIYYGIGLHMGVPVRQNPKGDLLGVVMNVGDVTKKTTRIDETNLYLPYHYWPPSFRGATVFLHLRHWSERLRSPSAL